jgi:hypothetical protein
VNSPIEPSDPATASADSPPLGGRRPYSWVYGLIGVVVFIGVVALLIALFGSDQNAPPVR